jgi:hypothetical protein
MTVDGEIGQAEEIESRIVVDKYKQAVPTTE